MTNFEQIELLLKHGLHVSVKDKDEEYLTISPVKDKNGEYRTSSWYQTLVEAKENIGESDRFANLEEACKEWSEITPFHLDFETYPVGMKVKVIKSGEVGEIENTKYKNMHILKGDSITYYFHTELIPYFEEESLSGKEVSVTIGDKTYKAIIK